MTLDDALGKNKSLVFTLAKQYGATNLRVFGSFVHGDATPKSDIDLLVEMEPGRDLLDLIGFSQDLEEKFGRKFDVLTDQGLSPYLRDIIRSEARPL